MCTYSDLLTKNLNRMKRMLFTVVYPFWFFLAKTWLGGTLMMCSVPLMPVLVIYLSVPSLMDMTGEESKDIGMCIAIPSLLICPFFAIPLIWLGNYLESHYKKWNYKIEMETKMI